MLQGLVIAIHLRARLLADLPETERLRVTGGFLTEMKAWTVAAGASFTLRMILI